MIFSMLVAGVIAADKTKTNPSTARRAVLSVGRTFARKCLPPIKRSSSTLLTELASADAVINELHYAPAPDIKTERVEFVELYNSWMNQVDLASWSLSGGIKFAFTNVARIAPDGYVAIAQDPAALGHIFGVTNAFGQTGRREEVLKSAYAIRTLAPDGGRAGGNAGSSA